MTDSPFMSPSSYRKITSRKKNRSSLSKLIGDFIKDMVDELRAKNYTKRKLDKSTSLD